MDKERKSKNIVNDAIVKDISNAIMDLQHGTIMIKIFDSKISQIEVTQRKRFDDVWRVEEGGGI